MVMGSEYVCMEEVRDVVGREEVDFLMGLQGSTLKAA